MGDRPEMKPNCLDERSLLIAISLIAASFTDFSLILQMNVLFLTPFVIV